jgi:hypothetical protein
MAPEFQEKRKHARYPCDLGVEVRTADAKTGYWGTLGDVSLGGCYVYTFSPLPAGTTVILVIKTSEAEIDASGKVVAFHPGVGMGIEFQGFINEGGESQFRTLLASMEKGAGAGTT